MKKDKDKILMKSIIKAMLEQIYLKADEFAKGQNQLVGERINGRYYYITLEQLEMILKEGENNLQ